MSSSGPSYTAYPCSLSSGREWVHIPHSPVGSRPSPLLSLNTCVFSPAHRSEGTQLPISSQASPEPEVKRGDPLDSGTRSPDSPPEGAWQSDSGSGSGSRPLDEGLSLPHSDLLPGSQQVCCAQSRFHGPVGTEAAIWPPDRTLLSLSAEAGLPKSTRARSSGCIA